MSNQADNIAIVGMDGTFPGADSIEDYWRLLLAGLSGLTRFDKDDLDQDARLVSERCGENYRAVRGVLNNACRFDAEFFGHTEEEARYLDPQYRQLLVHVYRALHDAHCVVPGKEPLNACLYASLSGSTYRRYLKAESDTTPFLSDYCSEDLAPLRISHRLNLAGTSMRVQSTCSSSLLGIHLACQALRSHECGIAVVAGASISFPQHRGYEWLDGGIHSKSGVCRPFDSRADGTIGGDAVAAIVLKREADAVRQGNRIYAMIKGSAANNDGAERMGFTAPSIQGQVKVIKAALLNAGVAYGEVGMVEAHGTATVMGDPIEFAALQEVFSQEKPHSICLTAVKGNIGHTDVVAGLAGLINAALCLHYKQLIPIAGYSSPNQHMDLDKSAFFVLGEAAPWRQGIGERVAAVTSLGMGGTNVHVVLSECSATTDRQSSEARAAANSHSMLVPIAANDTVALEELCDRLYRVIEASPEATLQMIARSACATYSGFPVRLPLVVGTREELLQKIAARDTKEMTSHRPIARVRARNPVFVFAGLQDITPTVVQELARSFSVLKQALLRLHGLFLDQFGVQLFPELCESSYQSKALSAETDSLVVLHGRTFAFQVALYDLCEKLEMRPAAMIGYSIGELAAAVCAQAIGERSAATILVARALALRAGGRAGWMIAVLCTEEQLAIVPDRFRAGNISPELWLLSGTEADWNRVSEILREAEISYKRVGGKYALHSGGDLHQHEDAPELHGELPGSEMCPLYSSFLGGEILEANSLQEVGWWLQQCTAPISFFAAYTNLLEVIAPYSFVQLGGGGNLAQIALGAILQSNPGPSVVPGGLGKACHVIFDISSEEELPPSHASHALLRSFGQLWSQGEFSDLTLLSSESAHPLVSLPPHPFDTQEFTLEGKINLDPFIPADGLATQIEHSRTYDSDAELEMVIVGEFARAFGERGRLPSADFFELGGHSLLAIQLLYRIEAKTALHIPVRELVASPTPRSLAAKFASVISKDARQSNGDPEVPISIVEMRGHRSCRLTISPFVDVMVSEAGASAMAFGDYIRANVADIVAEARARFDVRLYPHELQHFEQPRQLVTLLEKALVESVVSSTLNVRPVVETVIPSDIKILSDCGKVIESSSHTSSSICVILSSARSGSTLLRVMLGGNPALFCPPELHLLMYQNLQERAAKLGTSHFANGLVRTYQELLGSTWTEAVEYTRTLEASATTVKDAYGRIKGLCGGRILIDKSPSYAEQMDTLIRIDSMFPSPYVIHLVRHPLAVIESYVRNRIAAMNSRYGEVAPLLLAEEHWITTNRNIKQFLSLKEHAHFFLKYEDLVANPEMEMRYASRALGIDYDKAMLDPYAGGRMIDGVGDPGIHEHTSIDPALARSWRSQIGDYQLSYEARLLAAELGYEV